jgi:hypothetical protein
MTSTLEGAAHPDYDFSVRAVDARQTAEPATGYRTSTAMTVLEAAREAAEATARIVPRRPTIDGAVSPPLAAHRKNDAGRSSRKKNVQVMKGGPPGARTSNLLIKSRMLNTKDNALTW